MAELILPRRFKGQPQYPAPLDRSLGITKAYIPANGAAVPVGGITPIIGTDGVGFRATSQTAYYQASSTKILSGLSQWSIVVAFATTQSTPSSGSALYCERGAGGGNILKLEGLGNGVPYLQMTVRDDALNLVQFAGSSTVTNDGKFHIAAGVQYSTTDRRLFIDGRQEASSSGSVTNAYTESGVESRIGADAADANSYVTGPIYFVGLHNTALSPAAIAAIWDRRWNAFFKAPARRLWSVPVNGTVALIGQALTSSQGTLAPSTSVALSGQSLTSSQGSLSPGISLSLTGQSLTSSQGALTPNTSIALSGQSLTSSQGALAANGSVTVALSGQSLTSSQGILGPRTTLTLSGQALTAAQGTLSSATSVALSGQTLTSSQGTLAPSTTGQSITIQLTGQSLTAAQGSLSLDQYIWDTTQGRAQPGRGTFRPLKPDEMSHPEIVVVDIPEEESTYEHHPVSDVQPTRLGPKVGISGIKLTPRPNPGPTPTTVQTRDYKALMARAGTKTKTMKLSDFPVKQNKKYLTKTRGPVTLKGN